MMRMSIWVFAARSAAQLGALVLLVQAASLLGPAELGAFVLVSVLALLLNLIAEAGWSQYVIACEEEPLPATIYWAAILAGALALLVGAGGALVLFQLYDRTDYGLILLILSFFSLFSPLSAVQHGILVRTGRVHSHSQLVILAELTGVSVAMIGLYGGLGIYALVLNKVVNQTIMAVGNAFLTRWFPRPELEIVQLKKILHFTRHILMSRVVGFLSVNSAELLIGILLGVTEVGIYRTASRITGAVTEILFETTRILSWSSFKKAHCLKAGSRLGAEATAFLGDAFFVLLPIYAGLALLAGNLVASLLGPVWASAVGPIILLAMTRMLTIPAFINEALFGLGKQVHILPRMMGGYMVLSIGLLALLGHKGIGWAAFSQLLMAILFLPVIMAVQMRLGGVNWRQLLKDQLPKALLVTLVMSLSMWGSGVWALQQFDHSGWALIVQLATGGLVYLLMVALLRRDLLQVVLQQLPLSARFSGAS